MTREATAAMALEALDGAGKAGILAAAASIVSGAGLITAPVKFLGLITLGTTTAVAWPLVAAAAAAGALAGGAFAAWAEHQRQDRIRRAFDQAMQPPPPASEP